MQNLSSIMKKEDRFFVGLDTDSSYKDSSIILNAYNGEVETNFTLNIVSSLSKKFSLNCDKNDFKYEVKWNEENQRIDMGIICIRSHIIKCTIDN